MRLIKPAALFKHLCSSSTSEKGRLLGVDVGLRYVGLAVSDVTNQVASPLSVLVRKKSNIDFIAQDFQTLVSRLSLVGFVVGLPFSLPGQKNVEAFQAKNFMDELRRTGKLEGLTYTYWDENYTSMCVQALLEPLDFHPVEAKTIVDKFAAVGILQGYLDDMRRKETELGNLDRE